MYGSGVMLDACPSAWMEAGNLLASLASLSPQYFATPRSICPLCILSTLSVSTFRDIRQKDVWRAVCIFL